MTRVETPWLETVWQQWLKQDLRLGHALLLSGPSGLGKRQLAERLAARRLCIQPNLHNGHACGQCGACRLRIAGNHPDIHPIVPDADTFVMTDSAAPAKGSTASKQIVIEQVRALQAALEVGGHQGGWRVVIVDPAEAMNSFTANALLKLLEEPPSQSLFILISAHSDRLLPTILSRCQRWRIPLPALATVHSVEYASSAEFLALLGVSGGMPLAAERLSARGYGPLLGRFVADLSTLPIADPLVLAATWESWLKSKEALQAQFDMVCLVDWLLRWVCDLTQLTLGVPPRFFSAQAPLLRERLGHTDVTAMTSCYNELIRFQKMAQHPLNARLMIEDMLVRYTRALNGKRQ